MRTPLRLAAAVCAAALGAAGTAAAQDARDAQGTQAEALPVFTLRTSMKGTGVVSRPPDSTGAFSGDDTRSEAMFRLRIEPEVRLTSDTTFAFAYEQRVHYTSSTAGLAPLGLLPPDAATPFRIRPLAWQLGESPGGIWRHEIDRANVNVRLRRANLTVGRQAIGWGRGVMFTAVDLFAPFSPLEVDREWRAGVDALRADVTATDRTSIDLVGAFGRTLDASVFAARARGFTGAVDVEVMGGRRARDVFGGLSTSAALGDAGVHAEAAVFRVPPDGVRSDRERAVWKVVAGGSYRFPIGSGILAYAEYHYSGFGAAAPEGITALFATPSFAERWARGDVQILSRHAVGVTASYEVSPEVAWSAYWLHNPRDGSGVAAPGLTYTFSDAASLLGMIYLPYGRPPSGGVLRSEYGAAAVSGLLQFRLYL